MLTHKRLLELLVYDPATGVFVWRVSRGSARAGSVAGHVHIKGARYICVGKKFYLAHRLAWFYMHGVWPADEIDHEKGRAIGDGIANLREATRTQNQQNQRRAHVNNLAGLLGVGATSGRFRARIRHEKKLYHLGYFSTREDAHVAYLDAKKRLHAFSTITGGQA